MMRWILRIVLVLILLSMFLATLVEAQNLDPDPAVMNALTLERVVDTLADPTAAAFLPDGRMVIIERLGGIKVVAPGGGGTKIDAGTMPVDQTFGERGLLGLAVDPQFATSNRLYFYYSANAATADNRNRVAWATIDPTTSIVDVENRHDILTGIYGPANHDGGGITFGPDGYLYVGAGDTGCNCNCDPGTNAQNYFATCLTNLNGKISRIDRDGNIPATNPLVGVNAVPACGANANCQAAGSRHEPTMNDTGPPRTEIYAWGFRNPWRFAFDSQTGYLWIGDVGEITYEEITVSKAGGEHHGWPFREGAHGQAADTCATYTPMSGNCVEPAYELPQSEQPGSHGSITGGVFSNHCSWPAEWRGRYWFGDYTKNRVWTLTPNAARDGADAASRVTIVRNAAGPVHFFEGNDGAIYFSAIEGNAIWKIAPATPAACDGMDAAGFPDAVVAPGDAEPTDNGVVGPAPDSGVVATDAGGSNNNGNGSGSSSGCGCDAPTRDRPAFVSIAALIAIAALMYTRRKRR